VGKDVQRARKIIATKGFSGLFDSLEKGVALPAAAAVVAPALGGLYGRQGE
jgi:hypothetical protein